MIPPHWLFSGCKLPSTSGGSNLGQGWPCDQGQLAAVSQREAGVRHPFGEKHPTSDGSPGWHSTGSTTVCNLIPSPACGRGQLVHPPHRERLRSSARSAAKDSGLIPHQDPAPRHRASLPAPGWWVPLRQPVVSSHSKDFSIGMKKKKPVRIAFSKGGNMLRRWQGFNPLAW